MTLKLVLKGTDTELVIGNTYKDFRGDPLVLESVQVPHKPSSTGRVHTDQGSYYPSVIGAEWIRAD